MSWTPGKREADQDCLGTNLNSVFPPQPVKTRLFHAVSQLISNLKEPKINVALNRNKQVIMYRLSQ